MAAGTLKMRNTDRGFGFVQNDADVFLHVTALQVSGIDIDEIKGHSAYIRDRKYPRRQDEGWQRSIGFRVVDLGLKAKGK